jgi:hypothetical protein
VYIAPDGSFSATYPSILRRIGAGAVDPRRRSGFDRLFGLVYVEELVFTHARRSPWAENYR